MQYVAYYRVSMDKQGKSGLSLASQRHSVEQYIANHKGKLLDAFNEVESGKKDNRPKLDKAIRHCLLTGAPLVIAKLDMLSRDIVFIANLQKPKVDFTCVDMPEANTLTIGMMAVMAQYERELVSERTKAELAAAKRPGIKLGNPTLHLVRPTDTSAATADLVANAELRNSQLRELITNIEAEQGDVHPRVGSGAQ